MLVYMLAERFCKGSLMQRLFIIVAAIRQACHQFLCDNPTHGRAFDSVELSCHCQAFLYLMEKPQRMEQEFLRILVQVWPVSQTGWCSITGEDTTWGYCGCGMVEEKMSLAIMDIRSTGGTDSLHERSEHNNECSLVRNGVKNQIVS
eukprot:scaffold10069_cov69-Cylindrotheca_fusiformis.AAC.14